MKALMKLLDKKEKELKERIEAEFALFRFELILASIPKSDRIKTTNAVKELRKEEWNKALKLAKGDVDKAYDIYFK